MNKYSFFQQNYRIPRFFILRYLLLSICLFVFIFCLLNFFIKIYLPKDDNDSKNVLEDDDGLRIRTLPQNSNFSEFAFVRSAFRVTNEKIRLSIVKHYKNNITLTYMYGKKHGEVSLICHKRQCLDFFSPHCTITGSIGLIMGLDQNDNNNFISLHSAATNTTTHINITDVRFKTAKEPYETSDYPHKLGICLQPIYLMTDYTLIIQFFEYWLNEGATKFYIYWESFSPEVQKMIEFYMKTSNADIELVEWSQLPFVAGNEKNLTNNPNAFWFRLEVFLSIFDCMHRARYKVKYIAQSDLDEMFYVSNKTLFEYLEEIDERNFNMANLHFRSKRVYLKTNVTEIANPKDFSFEAFKHFSIDLEAFQRPFYIKIIHRPEREFFMDIHRSNRPERIPGSSKSYKTVYASATDATVWHFRRIKDHYKISKIEETSVFKEVAEIWKSNFQKRIQTKNLINRKLWTNYGMNVQLEECRQRLDKVRLKRCHSLLPCELEINTTKVIKWSKAINSWNFV